MSRYRTSSFLDLQERGMNLANFPRLAIEIDDTGRFNRAYTASTIGTPVWAPAGTYQVGGVVTPVPGVPLIGAGELTVIQDTNTSGAMISYNNPDGTSKEKHLQFYHVNFQLACDKATGHMIELMECGTANFLFEGCLFTSTSFNNRVKAAVYLKDVWEGAFRSCKVTSLNGASVWYTNPSQNGGNVHFEDFFHWNCSGGIYIDGSATTNNCLFDNVKFVAVSNAYQYYYQMTTGLPALGASSIQLPTGLSVSYFNGHQSVILFSSQGLEIVHVSSYNTTTGVLTLEDSTTLNHSASTDLRIITGSNVGLVTSFLTPNIQADCCHFEGVVSVIKDSPNSTFKNSIFNARATSSSGTGYVFFVGGNQIENVTFENSFFVDSPNNNTNCTMVFAMAISGITNIPGIEIDKVTTYPENHADETGTAFKPLDGDSTFWSFGNFKVRTNLLKGVQKNNVPERIYATASPPAQPLVSGTVYQNTSSTNSADTLYIPITFNPTTGASATVNVALGTSSAPSSIYTDNVPANSIVGGVRTIVIRVPPKWYYSVTVTNATIGNGFMQTET